ncbi:restriction endonuclease [Bacillus sp. 179-C3.3 HS]|uniref:restriction endonuclease n=1 Tax=Bacillus sp. 179-C3.3 HS TaxID=3232162 RepID=UPI0039A19062
MFFQNQSQEQKEEYVRLLQAVGSISNLFSDSEIPYLYYRAAENIFCRSFNAHNLSRGDITFDALKDGIGIALKTFQHRNGRCVEKIAEFNGEIENFQNRTNEEIIYELARLRNERIDLALHMTDAVSMMYHLVTRKEGVFELHEEELQFIDFRTLRLNTRNTTSKTIWFRDRHAEYRFSKSKSTLYKRFITNNPVATLDVDILENPFDLILSPEGRSMYLSHESFEEQYQKVVLPLYSSRDGLVYPRSGLNAWNADQTNRSRDVNEAYIPVPVWIHQQFRGFFPYDLATDQKENFTIILPNGNTMSSKMCQTNGKGLMSNPNVTLGEWILRTVLCVPEGTVVTKQMLIDIGIDSVIVTKLDNLVFQIDFAETGTYDEFELNNRL